MFPDHGHRWPLWGDVLHDELCLKPSDLHLSDDLTLELRSLYDFWERHETSCWTTPTPTGWDSNENLRVRELAAAEAERRLVDEVAYYGIHACGSRLHPKRNVALPMRSLNTASPWSSSRPEPAPGWTPRSRLRTPRVRNERPRPSAALPDRAREVECRGFRIIEVDAQQT